VRAVLTEVCSLEEYTGWHDNGFYLFSNTGLKYGEINLFFTTRLVFS